ncbi:DUF4351 domain-containing protein [Clostridium sp. YIM B02505]|uniref:DUF4351 domain-containing protein n=1 Tax=Clostridium yunnanense TaxID=2800325 RepID=A0ABS1EV49_9CLOT|nr:DUF4351 domain-containing protein [Clostridium yunnanense]MBK1813185.1 DUF4351 domain-containing protein [Clostridium yunnanense]
MIRDDGMREGREAEKVEILIKLLIKKFKKLPLEYEGKIKQLPITAIDVITTDIFDIEAIEDLQKYF